MTPQQLEQMIAAARQVQEKAYAPYSKFQVGAAILFESGEIVTGCNVENASFGLTICAERNAVARAIAQGEGKPLACVVVGPTEEPLTPCGACRQVLLEFNPAMEIVCVGENGDVLSEKLNGLLPHSFGSEDLDQ